MFTVAVMQGYVLAENTEAGRLNSGSSGISFRDVHGGYTRTIVVLLIIIAMIIATVYVLGNKYGVRTNIGRSKYIQIIDHTPLGVKKSVFLVKVPGKYLLLGVTSDRIGMLTEIANENVPECHGGDIQKKEFLNVFKKSISRWKQG